MISRLETRFLPDGPYQFSDLLGLAGTARYPEKIGTVPFIFSYRVKN